MTRPVSDLTTEKSQYYIVKDKDKGQEEWGRSYIIRSIQLCNRTPHIQHQDLTGSQLATNR
jgi:hypothetical protein